MVKLHDEIKKYKSLPVQIKASVCFLICSFLQKGISTITTPIFTRLLSAAEYGQYNTFNSWLSILTVFITLYLSAGVYSQGLVKFENERDVFSSSLQGLTLFLVVGWTLVYILFHDFWNHLFSLTTVQTLAMLVMIWTSAVFSFWAAEQRVLYRYRALVALTIVVSIAKPVVGIVFVVLAEDKVTARILGLVLVELVGYTGLFFQQVRRGKKLYSAKFWKYAIEFNLPLIPHYLSQNVLSSADRIMISEMVGAEAAGIYSLAYSISLIMTLFNNALSQTISPWIYQKIKANKVTDIEPIAYTTLILIALVNIILIAFAPEAVAVFAPKEYYEAIYVIPPVAMSVFFMYSYDLFSKFAFYYEKTKFVMIASVVGAALNILLNYIFIGKYGYIAAGYTTLVCYIAYAIGHYALMNKVCADYCNGVRPYKAKHILQISVAFVLTGFALLFSYRIPAARYSLIIVMLIGVFTQRERILYMIKSLVGMRKAKK